MILGLPFFSYNVKHDFKTIKKQAGASYKKNIISKFSENKGIK